MVYRKFVMFLRVVIYLGYYSIRVSLCPNYVFKSTVSLPFSWLIFTDCS